MNFQQVASCILVIALFFATWMITLGGVARSQPAEAQAFSSASHSLPGGVIEHSSPTLADLDGDDIPEVIVGTTAQNGAQGNARNRPTVLVVLRGDGSILWSKPVDAPINSAPAVGDINRDGQPEIVISTGGDVGDRNHTGSVITFDPNGNQLWRFNSLDHAPKDGYGDGFFASPTLCDVDGDYNLEIAIGGWDQRIYLLDHNGAPIWNNLNLAPGVPSGPGYYNADSVWSTAACADLNDDGFMEIIVGADMTGGGILPDGTHSEDGGFLYVFDKNGQALVRRHISEAVYSSPAVADLNLDGKLEIVVGTSWFWWNQKGRQSQSYVYAFDTSNLFSNLSYANPAKLPDLPGWPQQTTYPGFSSPAVADLDGDKDLEIVIGSGHPFIQNDPIPGSGQIHAWHHTGQLVAGWPVSPKNDIHWDSAIFASPVVADIDADGQVEVLIAMVWDIQVYNANGVFQQLLKTNWTTVSSPAVGDTDGDGKMDIWIGSGNALGDQSSGHLWRFENTAASLGAQPWPTFHRDAANTGYYAHPQTAKAVLGATSIFVLESTADGISEQVESTLTLSNQGDLPYDWEITNQPEVVTVTPISGTVAGHDSVALHIAIDASDLTTGTHALGAIDIAATSEGEALPGSPFSIPVTVYVGPVESLYLPVVRR